MTEDLKTQKAEKARSLAVAMAAEAGAPLRPDDAPSGYQGDPFAGLRSTKDEPSPLLATLQRARFPKMARETDAEYTARTGVEPAAAEPAEPKKGKPISEVVAKMTPEMKSALHAAIEKDGDIPSPDVDDILANNEDDVQAAKEWLAGFEAGRSEAAAGWSD